LVCAKALFLVFHGHESACDWSLWSLSYSRSTVPKGQFFRSSPGEQFFPRTRLGRVTCPRDVTSRRPPLSGRVERCALGPPAPPRFAHPRVIDHPCLPRGDALQGGDGGCGGGDRAVERSHLHHGGVDGRGAGVSQRESVALACVPQRRQSRVCCALAC